jgi:putative phosphotransacetylase
MGDINMKVKVGVSVHHVHLTKEAFEKLFPGIEIDKRNNLHQLGEFATNHVVDIKSEDHRIIKNVRVLGPFRSYNQVEISKTESVFLKLDPPVRNSGNIENSPGIKLISEYGELDLPEGVIIAERHIHLNTLDVEKLGYTNQQKVQVKVDTIKGGVMDAFIKISDNGYFEMHIDTDDANAFFLTNDDEVEIIDEY